MTTVGSPLHREVFDGLVEVVGDDVDVAGVAGAAHRDVGQLSPAAVGEDVGAVDGRSLHSVDRDGVGVVEAVVAELFAEEALVAPVVESDGQLLVADCGDGAAFARHKAAVA